MLLLSVRFSAALSMAKGSALSTQYATDSSTDCTQLVVQISSTLTFRRCGGGLCHLFMMFTVFDVLLTTCRR